MAQLRKNLTEKMESNPGKVHFRRWKAMSIGARISLIVLTLIVLIAALANFIAPHDPLEIFTARQAPDAEFIFGTDDKGRDVLSRMMYSTLFARHRLGRDRLRFGMRLHHRRSCRCFAQMGL